MGSPWDLRRAQNLFLTSQWDLCELWTTSEKFSKFGHSLTWLSILTWSLGYCYRSQLHNLTGHLGQNSWIYTKRQESFFIGHWTRVILAYRSLKSVDFEFFLKNLAKSKSYSGSFETAESHRLYSAICLFVPKFCRLVDRWATIYPTKFGRSNLKTLVLRAVSKSHIWDPVATSRVYELLIWDLENFQSPEILRLLSELEFLS